MEKNKILFLCFLLIFFIKPFSENNDLPEILIEGTEIEKITEGESRTKKISIEKEKDEKEKVKFKKIEEKKENEISENSYRYSAFIGTNILAKVNINGFISKKNLSISPEFGYYHFYPYIRDRYYENFKGDIKLNLNTKDMTTFLILNGMYDFYEYEEAKNLNNTALDMQLGFDKIVNSNIKILNITGFKYTNLNSISNFLERSVYNRLNISLFLSPIILIRSNIHLYLFNHFNPIYNIMVSGKYKWDKITFSLGISGAKYTDRKLIPLFGLRMSILKGISFILENKVSIEKKTFPSILPYFSDFATTFYIKNSCYGYFKFNYKKLIIKSGVQYSEESKNNLYAEDLYTEDMNFLKISEDDIFFIEPFINLNYNNIVKLNYFYNPNRTKNVPYQRLEFITHYNYKKIGWDANVNYLDMTEIEDNKFLSPIVFYNFSIGYNFAKSFQAGIGTRKDFYDFNKTSNYSIYVVVKGEL